MSVSDIARMNLASLSDEGLELVRLWFVQVKDNGTEEGRARAPEWLEAIDDELASRKAGQP